MLTNLEEAKLSTETSVLGEETNEEMKPVAKKGRKKGKGKELKDLLDEYKKYSSSTGKRTRGKYE
jgi:hypothetical protein